MLRPFLIVVSPHRIDRGDLTKPVKDLLPVNIPAVQDGVTALQRLQDLRP